ncbi:endo-1,4-beta-xylanase [Paenibacillus sedimenti]|uniref:endo-1,4-beta-xylanase n=1 Tax=Paenibacillus sedimenti TaxID=2770274 RepID=UPI00289D9B04|nr:endo-1,4-beta-xylanase [Paenibacillus sedimenti]
MTNVTFKQEAVASLFEKFQGIFDIGAAVTPRTIHSQGVLLKKHYNSVTAENQMKFAEIHPEPHRYTFEAADSIVDFAVREGKKVRGHTLVWHNQTPDWVFQGDNGAPAAREQLLARMERHIEIVVKRYRGQVYAWDVVNEAIEDTAEVMLRKSKWLDIIGEDYIAKAFEYAHRVDPNAVLFYNDYNETNPVKREKIYSLVKSLLDQGVPIHGIGMQGHWNIHGPTLAEIREAIERYASLGVQLQITELDLSMFEHEDRRTDLIEPSAELQAQRYEQMFDLFKEFRGIITAVTFWGAADDHTWLDDFPVKGRKNWPFLFDNLHVPKKSFHNIMK